MLFPVHDSSWKCLLAKRTDLAKNNTPLSVVSDLRLHYQNSMRHLPYNKAAHYVNMAMQYAAIFKG